MNKVILMGNIGQDPELAYTNNGTPVCKASLATSEKWRDDSGDLQERVTWHRVVIWGKPGEVFSKHVGKGSKILIEGSITNRSYEDKEGIKRYVSEIRVDRFEFCGTKRNEDAEEIKSSNNKNEKQQKDSGYNGPINDDDIPF